MVKIKKVPCAGDIFAIPLYLPSYQKWREPFDEFIDYKKYKFNGADTYAFGRIIEDYCKNCYIMEIFRCTGRIPDEPEGPRLCSGGGACAPKSVQAQPSGEWLAEIKKSGRMFKPIIAGGMFQQGRWRVISEDPDYDKRRDSDYENITFLYVSEIWKGGKSTHITHDRYVELFRSGNIPAPSINGAVGVECDIRQRLKEQGIDLNYEQTVEERRDGYPLPRDMDKKLKETVLPFRWLSGDRIYSLTLDADALNGECFAEAGIPGNGYAWEKIAAEYIKENLPEARPKIKLDCEADSFAAIASTKKVLKEFALGFHQLCTDKTAFTDILKRSHNF